MTRWKKGEVQRMALTYFATKKEGHTYDFQKEFKIDRYCSAQVAVKFLEKMGWIYPTKVEVGGRGYVRRKLYRLSIFGFLKVIADFHHRLIEIIETPQPIPLLFDDFIVFGKDPDELRNKIRRKVTAFENALSRHISGTLDKEVKDNKEWDEALSKLKKVFEIHSRLCPAFFKRCSGLDDAYVWFIVSMISYYGRVYFDTVPPFLRLAGFEVVSHELPIELVEKAAPFVFCSLIIDNCRFGHDYTRMWLQLGINEKIVPTLKKARRINLTLRDIELLVFKTIPPGSFIVSKDDLDELKGEKIPKRRLVVFEDAFSKYLERFNGNTEDPNELLKWTVRMKMELVEEEVKRLAELNEVLQ
ncbi:MAG TPA: hypothetical protein ENG34_00400 [Candidatus Aenigmarchaeota archaeon]|nr:hypothetical protein [Candidatus Aenigmarchaeota archaeon]